MTSEKLLADAIGTPLKDAGFKKKPDGWYFDNAEVVEVVNLQKSQYGGQYYVNCAVALRSIGTVEYPKENHCHIRFRLTSILPEARRHEIEALLNLENSMPEQQRSEQISDLVRAVILPALSQLSSEEGIIDAIKSNKLRNAMVHRRVKDRIID